MYTRLKVQKECLSAASRHNGKCLKIFRREGRWFARCKCDKGHVWSQKAYSLIKGQWCWECTHDSPRANIEFMRKTAELRSGRCESNTWRGSSAKLKWSCALGHVWCATPNSILNGRWCPECSAGLSERICRAYFAAYFATDFPTAWPAWLVNSAGNRMELDGFSKRLGIAFEYQGHQHYKKVPHFKSTSGGVIKQKKLDAEKRALCEKHGVVLICVPYTQKLSELPKFIFAECKRLGIKHKRKNLDMAVDLKSAYSPSEIGKLREVAENRGGRLITSHYHGVHFKYKWECENNHEWEADGASVQRGAWCPECAGKKKWDIAGIKKWARENGLNCLSSEYLNNKSKLIWECPKKHRWPAQWNSVHAGSRCPVCANERRRGG